MENGNRAFQKFVVKVLMRPKLSVVARLFEIVFVIGTELANKKSFFSVSDEENLIVRSCD